MIGPSITEKQLFTTLRGFLTTILPNGTPVIRAAVNRVASPPGDFVLMSALRRERLETNIDTTFDIKLTGQIVGDTLTVYAIQGGRLAIGSVLFGGPNLPTNWDAGATNWDAGATLWDSTIAYLLPGTQIAAFGTGTGLTGTYTITPAPQTTAIGPLYAGVTTTVMPTEITIQLDVFGPASAENAQRISTLLRDEFATHYFDGTGILQTLHADDPRQMPFIDSEAQYEYRWIVEAHLQANIEVDTPMQFADQVVIAIPPPVDGGDVDLLVDPDGDVMIDPDGDPIRVGGVTTTTVV